MRRNMTSKRERITGVNRIEIGCGSHKREGFFGIDVLPSPVTDLVLDVETEALPFADDSIDYIYSSHAFEHLEKPGSPIQTLRELVRVARDGATVEIWTPYGKSNDGLLPGHHNFYTESHWKHICYEYDGFYLGEQPGRFFWERTQYVMWPGIVEKLIQLNIPLEFALDHMFNIALEFGVFLKVEKQATKARSPQIPVLEFCYQRGEVLPAEQLRPPPPPPPPPPPTLFERLAPARIVHRLVGNGKP